MEIPKTSRKGYIYLMQKDINSTLRALWKLKPKIVEKRVLKEKSEDNYYGWIRFPRPIPLLDAMDAGLVPIFNCYRTGATE